MPESRGISVLAENLFNFFVPKSKEEAVLMVATGPFVRFATPAVAGALGRMGLPKLADDILEPLIRRIGNDVGKIQQRVTRPAQLTGRQLSDAEVQKVARIFVDDIENQVAKAAGDPLVRLRLNAETLGIPKESALRVHKAVDRIRAARTQNLNAINRANPELVDEAGNLLNRLPAGSTTTGGRGTGALGAPTGTPTVDALRAREAARRAAVARKKGSQKP